MKKSCFEAFKNAGYYDGPDSSSINNYIAKTETKDLEEIEPPFIWAERVMLTHLPYGKIDHERRYEFEISGKEYIEKGRKGEIDLEKEYREGCTKMGEYVKERINELEERGILGETLVIITSDHGECLGEKFLGRKRYDHNFPAVEEIAQVPTVFYNYDLEAESMRLIDVIPTALSIVGKKGIGDGVDVRETEIREGRNIMDDPKVFLDTEWKFNEGWKIENKLYRLYRTLWGDLKKTAYNLLGRELSEKLREKIERQTADKEVMDIDV
ncbi:MAG: sulfatase-like hydrolase/transferase [Candidatus Nanohaloarchaeota archaeon QJJ-9]|nr:sulfatase-like hydrolase/transferase [Candidatus Nanohaloarchaeota archaeon QJJ-9]